MRPLWILFAAAVAVCHARPGGEFGYYDYPSHPPEPQPEDDFAHKFRYKEYFPTPHYIGVGSGYLDSKMYAVNHAYPSVGDHIAGGAHYIASSIGHHLGNKAHAISDHVGGKISYVASAAHDHFKGHHDDGYIYADGFGQYGQHGPDKLGAIAHGVGESLKGPISTIKYVHSGISDAIGNTAKSVRDGLGDHLSNVVHTVKVAGSDLSDHLSRSAVHVKKGITGTIADSSYTAKTLFGILSEFLGKKVSIIGDGVKKQFYNTKHAFSEANAAIFRHIGKKALGVGEFLQNKAHEINVSIEKKLHRDQHDDHHDDHHDDVPYKFSESFKAEIPVLPKTLGGFDGVPYSSGVIGSTYAASSLGPAAYGGGYGGAYSIQKPSYLFQPTKSAISSYPLVQSAPLAGISASQYPAESYTKI